MKTFDRQNHGLPVSLGDGLVLRWATTADTEAIIAFNRKMHGEGKPWVEEEMANWTSSLLGGNHPTTLLEDFLVVVDENKEGKLISTLMLISQTWRYENIPFNVGRIELVGTDEEYRRRGLIRRQMEIIHARSASRGEPVQAITGIPWYYRQFGYEMCLNLSGERRVYFTRVPILPKPKEGENPPEENFRFRLAREEDIPFMNRIYDRYCARELISRVRSEDEWRYDLSGTSENGISYRRHFIIENLQGTPVAYGEARPNNWSKMISLSELGVVPGLPLRPVAEFVTRSLKEWGSELNKTREDPLIGIAFNFGPSHSIYDAMNNYLEKLQPSYGVFLRVPDLPAFLLKIAPVLEKRLIDSPAEGYTGTIRLNFYTSWHTLVFEEGRLKEVGTYTSKSIHDGDVNFPGLTFLHLLFGYRSFDDLRYAHPECYSEKEEATLLLKTIFPPKPSNVRMVY